jgi:hypothetical protein
LKARTYTQGGKTHTLSELDNLFAVNYPWAVHDPVATHGLDTAPFIAAGWKFVSSPKGFGRVAKVCVDSNGALKLALPLLVVKFLDHMTPEEISDALGEHGLEAAGIHSFTKNLLGVESSDSSVKVDFFDLADKLRQLPALEFAEVEFIEPVTRR